MTPNPSLTPTRTSAHHTTQRRGIAMLLVLATLVLATSAVVALGRVAIDSRLAAEARQRAATADRLLDVAETPILDWLHRHAGRLVLPPDASSPRFPVLDDTFQLGGEPARLTITAFDQCGMTPTTARSSATDSLLPADLVAALDRLGDPYARDPGLDLLAAACDHRVFPISEPEDTALGELAATHNPPRPGGRPVVNINTAPLPLIEAVYRARGLGGIDAVLEARAAGRVASPGALRNPRDDSETDTTPLPVSMSTAWAFRVDCRVGNVLRSWWCVYTDTGSAWERIQRLAIAE